MNKRIDALPSADAITGVEIVPIMQSGITKQTTISDLRPYKVYTALLTQSGTDAPTAIVLENTIGEISFTYENPGFYVCISDNLFILEKTWGIADAVNDSANGVYNPVLIDRSIGADDMIYIKVIGGDNNGDGLLNYTPIEIRVYN